jgi:Xaa-Pro aminopeptidase
MTELFTDTFFRNNRKKLRQLTTDCDILIISGNGLLQRGADSTYPFAQDANFWYLTGVSEPDLMLVIDESEEYIIVPGRTTSREAFDGAISFDELIKTSGVTAVYEEEKGLEILKKRLAKGATIGMPAPAHAYIPQLGFYTNPARAVVQKRIEALSPSASFIDITMAIRRMRAVKQAPEIAAIQQAIDITIATVQDISAKDFLSRQTHEYQIEAAITAGFRSRGAAGHAFEPIVAAGKQACILHNVANNGALPESSLVVVDVGAEVSQYAADITRTIAFGEATARQRQVHAAVLEVHEFARSLLKPGVLLIEYEKKVAEHMGEKLKELGLVKQPDTETIRKYFPHATSHFLGLNVHDVGEYDKPLEPNMALTVEPGIYIPEEGIGVRIEDDVLVTKTGIKVLSSALARELL